MASIQLHGEDPDREIVIERYVAAPRDLVFKVWTDPAHVGNWWGPRGFRTTTTHLDLRPGGEWKFLMHGPDGTDYPNHIMYDEVVAPERLRYRTFGDGETKEVRFLSIITFTEEGAGTRVRMRSIFPSAAVRNLVVEKYGAIEGGRQHLDRLAEHVTHLSPDTFVISRVFAAPRDLVFRCWVEPERMAAWTGPKGFKSVVKQADIRPGGVLHTCMETPDGKKMWGKWQVREVMPPLRLTYVNQFSDEAGGLTRHPMAPTWPLELLTTVTFEEVPEGTRLTLMWTPINETPEERATFAAAHDSMRGGWGGSLDKLAEYLAG